MIVGEISGEKLMHQMIFFFLQRFPVMTPVQSFQRSLTAGRAHLTLTWCTARWWPISVTRASRWWAPKCSCVNGTWPGVETCPAVKEVKTHTHTFMMITTLSKIHFHPISKPARTAYWSRAMLCSKTRWAFEFHLRGEFHKCLFASATWSHSRTGEEWRRALWVITHFSFKGDFTDEAAAISLRSIGASSSMCSHLTIPLWRWFLWFELLFHSTPACETRPHRVFQQISEQGSSVVTMVAPVIEIKSCRIAIV